MNTARILATRAPLLAAAMVCLVAGLLGGLGRLPAALSLPVPKADWVALHGPLMTVCFLGTLIALERAVALGLRWGYAAPVLCAAGGLMTIAGVPAPAPVLVLSAGGLVLAALYIPVAKRQANFDVAVMAAGAVALLVGNGLWLARQPIHLAMLWWAAFLILTILGERIELSRFQKPSPWARPMLAPSVLLMVAGLACGFWRVAPGQRLFGLSLLALALWLGTFDIARRTVRKTGLARYTAVCLLTGFAWLGVSGALFAAKAPLVAGFPYDAAVHALFVGFVFSMIFGHAPIIFPAILHRPVPFRRFFYLHLALLHVSLLLRVAGDLAGWMPGRSWGGTLNALAILLFLFATVSSVLRGEKR